VKKETAPYPGPPDDFGENQERLLAIALNLVLRLLPTVLTAPMITT
jgi:hypothetical protein